MQPERFAGFSGLWHEAGFFCRDDTFFDPTRETRHVDGRSILGPAELEVPLIVAAKLRMSHVAARQQTGPGLKRIGRLQITKRGRNAHRRKDVAQIQILDRAFTMPNRMGLPGKAPHLIHRQLLQRFKLFGLIVIDGQTVVQNLAHVFHVCVMTHQTLGPVSVRHNADRVDPDRPFLHAEPGHGSTESFRVDKVLERNMLSRIETTRTGQWRCRARCPVLAERIAHAVGVTPEPVDPVVINGCHGRILTGNLPRAK